MLQEKEKVPTKEVNHSETWVEKFSKLPKVLASKVLGVFEVIGKESFTPILTTAGALISAATAVSLVHDGNLLAAGYFAGVSLFCAAWGMAYKFGSMQKEIDQLKAK